MNPEPPADPKPTMPRADAEWAIHNAAVNARAEAARNGDPRATEALLIAGLPGTFEINGLTLHPPGVGHLLLVEQLRTLCEELGKDPSPLALAYVMGAPEIAWGHLNAQSGDAASRYHGLEKTVFTFSLSVTTPQLAALTGWLNRQFALIGDEATPPAEPGNVPGAAISLPTGPEAAAPHPDPTGS